MTQTINISSIANIYLFQNEQSYYRKAWVCFYYKNKLQSLLISAHNRIPCNCVSKNLGQLAYIELQVDFTCYKKYLLTLRKNHGHLLIESA